MIRTSILAATLLSATALLTVPAAAYTDDGDQVRQSRNWTGNQSSDTTSATRTRRGTTANQRGNTAPSTGTRDIPRNETASNSRDDDDDNYSARRNHRDEGGLDPREAARIRQAHEDTDGHVYMRRGHGHDGTPSYRSGYTTTYRGEHGREFEAPRHRRHHWWHVWWN
jgi:hypothetical protein